MPQLQSVYLRQDNAGCYHCSLSIVTARQVAEVNGLRLARMDFSDAQGGKGPCDRKAATIKSHIAVHLNSGTILKQNHRYWRQSTLSMVSQEYTR